MPLAPPFPKYTWDSNHTHVSSPLPDTLQTDGYPQNGIPLSSDWNAIMSNITDRLSYLENFWNTGDVKPTFNSTVPAGWIQYIDGTIGSALSGATVRANADTQDLYELLWNSTIDTDCPVIGGRGLSAVADFTANKPLTLPKTNGYVFLNYHGATFQGQPMRLAQSIGEQTHTLTIPEMPNHDHTGPGGAAFYVQTPGDGNTGNGSLTLNSENSTGFTGGGEPHNNMQPSTGVIVLMKL